ncbi:MAG: hypothetical protein JSS42_05185 [Proteobacteria bacterium]|uniref:InlB B-repeat-containing protein n=1 Tax=Rudaea sp. TaxID=2136325 RepID=UPI00321FC12E|nr:hypothetical protein [Pseudomonadota bacterium]
MRKLLTICAAWSMFFAPGTWAATYTFASGNYDSNHITVGSNPYTTAMKTTGSFTVGPLPTNQAIESDAIASLQTWSVNDGVTTHTPANSIPTSFAVSTDAGGTITGFTLNVTTSPMAVGQPAYVAFVGMPSNGSRNVTVQFDSSCSATATSAGKTFCNSLLNTGGDAVASASALAGSFSTGSTAPTTYIVTPSAGTGGTISPSTPQTVNSGATATFTVTPASGYQITGVGGTCGGTLSGNAYTTNAVTANCTVSAAFSVVPASAPSVSAPALGRWGLILLLLGMCAAAVRHGRRVR